MPKQKCIDFIIKINIKLTTEIWAQTIHILQNDIKKPAWKYIKISSCRLYDYCLFKFV